MADFRVRKNVSDSELIERYLGGDQNAASEFFVRHEAALESFLVRIGASIEDAEDTVHDVFVGFFSSLKSRPEQFDSTRPVLPWLKVVARNKWVDFVRRNNKFASVARELAYTNRGQTIQTPLTDAIDREKELDQEEVLSAIKRYLDSLPEQDRRLLQGKWLSEKFSYENFCIAENKPPTEENRKMYRRKVSKMLEKIKKMFGKRH